MKKKLLLPLLLLPFLALAQPMTVSTTLYTVPQLVNNVLINAPCNAASNITWRTGTFYGAANGIGYFQNANPAFPMAGGVILATTNAANVPGPNSSVLLTNPSWSGDPTLNTALGLSNQTVDATKLEFDFTPSSGYFSFDFLYASEEYTGTNTQCYYSDRFVFLLTNTATGITKNIAVLPNTTIPASSLTIRNATADCPAVNEQYFGGSNLGPAAATSATNFNGQTVVLKAQSIVEPNVLYHMKMIIADYGDSALSSAIFLGQNSLNIGQEVLGPDLLAASNNAACSGNPYTLTSGLDSSAYTFLWSLNGVPLVAETGPTLIITQPGDYTLTYASANCAAYTDNIKVEFQDCLGIAQPELAQATLYPNPTENDFTVSYPLTEKATIYTTVTNILGQIVYSDASVQFPGRNEKLISLQGQPSGIYLVRLMDGKNTFNGKIVKK